MLSRKNLHAPERVDNKLKQCKWGHEKAHSANSTNRRTILKKSTDGRSPSPMSLDKCAFETSVSYTSAYLLIAILSPLKILLLKLSV